MHKEDLNPVRGTKDWLGLEALNRERIIDVLQRICQSYGYSPIQTPVIENVEILERGYRGSREPSFFRILDRGESLKKRYVDLLSASPDDETSSLKLGRLADMGLRYDLTIPTARIIERYSLQYFFPLKRYQVGPVWRTDKPAAGRLREFTVCDVDAIGTSSMVDDAELIMVIYDIFDSLRIPVEILVNNRKIITFTDSIPVDPENDAANNLSEIERRSRDMPIVQEGIWELKQILELLAQSHVKPGAVKYTPGLRRSLAYYAGTIIEARAVGIAELRSPMNGGRYSETLGTFAATPIPTVGVSMSLERMQAALRNTAEGVSPNSSPDILVAVAHGELMGQAIRTAARLRASGLRTMLYSNASFGLKSQMKFADKNRIRLVAIVSDTDIVVRDYITGKQKSINPAGTEILDFSELSQE